MKENFELIKKTSRRTAILSIAGFLIIIFSLIYSYFQLTALQKKINEKKEVITKQEEKIKSLDLITNEYKTKAELIQKKVENLEKTQQSLLDFLVSVTHENQVNILDPSVDWDEITKQLNELPAGKRKNAILIAILLAWKDIPFTMGKENVRYGFDSPRFLRYVLDAVGLNIETKRGVPLSVTLMNFFKKTDDPKPGDLVFFKGQVGNFGFILASIGRTDEEHVGIGTLQKIAPLQIVRMGNINTPFFPLRGYFRVKYPDEN